MATSDHSPGSESAANAIDDQATQHKNFDKLNAGFTVSRREVPRSWWVSPSPRVWTGPKETRPPIDWKAPTTAPISWRSAAAACRRFPKRFSKQYLFFAPPPNTFTSYRLTFPTIVNANAASSMQIGEVQLLSATLVDPPSCSPDAALLIRKQPVDTPVLLGARATFLVSLTGPWQVQWYRNGVAIPGATSPTHVTPPASPDDDGARYRARVTARDCQQAIGIRLCGCLTACAPAQG